MYSHVGFFELGVQAEVSVIVVQEQLSFLMGALLARATVHARTHEDGLAHLRSQEELIGSLHRLYLLVLLLYDAHGGVELARAAARTPGQIGGPPLHATLQVAVV